MSVDNLARIASLTSGPSETSSTHATPADPAGDAAHGSTSFSTALTHATTDQKAGSMANRKATNPSRRPMRKSDIMVPTLGTSALALPTSSAPSNVSLAVARGAATSGSADYVVANGAPATLTPRTALSEVTSSSSPSRAGENSMTMEVLVSAFGSLSRGVGVVARSAAESTTSDESTSTAGVSNASEDASALADQETGLAGTLAALAVVAPGRAPATTSPSGDSTVAPKPMPMPTSASASSVLTTHESHLAPLASLTQPARVASLDAAPVAPALTPSDRRGTAVALATTPPAATELSTRRDGASPAAAPSLAPASTAARGRTDVTTTASAVSSGGPSHSTSGAAPLATSVAPVIALAPVAATTPVVTAARVDDVATVHVDPETGLDATTLASVLTRPLSESDGTYSLTLAMHPHDLGRVGATVSMSGNEIQVTLVPQSLAAHATLANSIDSLRHELGRDGATVTVASVSRGRPRSPPRRRTRPPRRVRRA